MNGYELTYNTVSGLLRNIDFADALRRLGFRINPFAKRPPQAGLDGDNEEPEIEELDRKDPIMYIDFLGRTYGISREGVEPFDGKEANANDRSVLAYYAASRGDGFFGEDFAQPHHFARGLLSGSSLGIQWMMKPLFKAFGDDYGLFSRAAEGMGMSFRGSPSAGTFIWQTLVLPKIPLRLVYIEADEEFPLDIQVFYDKTVPSYLEFEPLAVLTGRFIRALASVGNR